jgi:hypothetical protein
VLLGLNYTLSTPRDEEAELRTRGPNRITLTLSTLATIGLFCAAIALTTSAALADKKPKPCPTCAPTLTPPDGRLCPGDTGGFDHAPAHPLS